MAGIALLFALLLGLTFAFGGSGSEDDDPPANTIDGTDGDDTLRGTDGDDLILGRGGDDLIFGRAGDDTLRGGEGNDTIYGGPGDDLIYGGDGDDSLLGGRGDDTLIGGAGNDVLRGGPGNDLLRGGAGDDTLFGGSGENTLLGGAGDDVFIIGDDHEGGGLIDGGPGTDTLDTRNVTQAVVLAQRADGSIALRVGGFGAPETRVEGIEQIRLGPGANSVDLTDPDGALTIEGGEGRDVISLGGGAHLIRAGGGDDRITLTDPTDGTHVDGGDGNDTLWLFGPDGLRITVAEDGSGIAEWDEGRLTYESIETLQGSSNGAFVDATATEAGVDIRLFGNDITMLGGSGDDRLEGNGTLRGGDGDDLLFGDGLLDGGAGDDILAGQGTLMGGEGNDLLIGRGLMDGGAGDDVLSTELLFPDAPFASIVMIGGEGMDRFEINLTAAYGDLDQFDSPVRIVDFAPGEIIALSIEYEEGVDPPEVTVEPDLETNSLRVIVGGGVVAVAEGTTELPEGALEVTFVPFSFHS